MTQRDPLFPDSDPVVFNTDANPWREAVLGELLIHVGTYSLGYRTDPKAAVAALLQAARTEGGEIVKKRLLENLRTIKG